MQAAAVRPQAEKRKLLQSRRCLILNADGNPLSTWPLSLVPAQDAVHALYRDRVTVLENWPDEFYRSPSMTIAVPKTAMLRFYAPISGDPKFCRRSILLRDRYRCQYCGERFESHELTYDHVLPRSLGGRTEWTNIVSACMPCNSKKANSLPNYSGRKRIAAPGQMRPLKEPRRPTNAELLRAGLEFLPLDIRETWQDTLYWGVSLEP